MAVKKILLAVDGSPASQSTAQMAGQFLDAFPQAQLTVLYVQSFIVDSYRDTLADRVHREEAQKAHEVERNVREQMLPRWSNSLSFRTEVGDPAAVIVAVAAEENTDLIIVGNHSRTVLDRLAVGGISHAVVHQARSPVLVVKGLPAHRQEEAQHVAPGQRG